MLAEPPITRPAASGSSLPFKPGCGALVKAQSVSLPRFSDHSIGSYSFGWSRSADPGSSSSTFTAGFAESRFASTQPAAPAPTTM
jgi:hypothetical protein